MKLETPRMLVLSTSHISETTNDLLRMRTDDVPLAFDKRSWGDDELLGWLIPIVGDEPLPHTCPHDLRAVHSLAADAGCTWILLDRDAGRVEGLPTWDW